MQKAKTKLMLGNNLELLKKLPDNSIDSIVSDPPYGLSFMNKKWDYDVPSVEFWREVYRVLKPGGHILSFGGTRTYHRMVVNIEDAGFEIRDQIQWLYGSGFPKSHNIGKAIDKLQGNDREIVGNNPYNKIRGKSSSNHTIVAPQKPSIITKGNSEYEGWGTALKPANEPICLARKPLLEKSVAENVLKWGTGGINIDGCRVGTDKVKVAGHPYESFNRETKDEEGQERNMLNNKDGFNEGRFPANIILDEIAAELLDEQSGITASRFFYQAKVSKGERNMSLDGFEEKHKWLKGGGGSGISDRENVVAKNNHPTVKPVALMTYLCRLITPKNGIILDPFMGSGSTGIAAQLEGFRFVGMEMDEDYFKIAEARIENFESYRKFQKNNN